MQAAVDLSGLTAAEPDLARLETIVTLCEQRVRRADAKVRSAAAEQADAVVALKYARATRDHWIANNPDPQLLMF